MHVLSRRSDKRCSPCLVTSHITNNTNNLVINVACRLFRGNPMKPKLRVLLSRTHGGPASASMLAIEKPPASGSACCVCGGLGRRATIRVLVKATILGYISTLVRATITGCRVWEMSGSGLRVRALVHDLGSRFWVLLGLDFSGFIIIGNNGTLLSTIKTNSMIRRSK